MLKSWLLRPSYDEKLLQERLNAVEFFTHPNMQMVCQDLQACLAKIGNVNNALQSLRNKPRVSDWGTLMKVSNCF